ncbi:hypothetical protein [Nostoc sp.]|uniref:hypothetical protein n=1 Tax=Nostoc sp. TaxID=1180 RepID=UPI002FF9AE43
MKLSVLIDSVLIVASIALLPVIDGAQTATHNSGEPIAINSNIRQDYSGSRLSEIQEPHPQPPKSKR